MGLADYYHQQIRAIDPKLHDPKILQQKEFLLKERSKWTNYAWEESDAQSPDRNRILKLKLLCVADETDFHTLKQMIMYLIELELQDMSFVLQQLEKMISKGNNKLLQRVLRKLSSKHPQVAQGKYFQTLIRKCRM